MNWTLIATIAISLIDPVNIGLAACTSGQEVQAVVDDVVVEVQALPSGIQAAFVATPTSGKAPLTVQFDASTSEGDNLTYSWDFGDGKTTTDNKLTILLLKLSNTMLLRLLRILVVKILLIK